MAWIKARLSCSINWMCSCWALAVSPVSSWGDLSPQTTSLLLPPLLASTCKCKQQWHHRTLQRDTRATLCTQPGRAGGAWSSAALKTLTSVAWNPQHQPPVKLHQRSRDWPSSGGEENDDVGGTWGSYEEGESGYEQRRRGLQCLSFPKDKRACHSQSELIQHCGGVPAGVCSRGIGRPWLASCCVIPLSISSPPTQQEWAPSLCILYTSAKGI